MLPTLMVINNICIAISTLLTERFQQSLKDKLIAMGTERASVMLGKSSGLVKRISDMTSKPVHAIHCSAHRNLPADWVLIGADFAENYRTFYQDEIQAAHWQYQQITVHPIVAYLKCPEEQCRDTSLVTESIVCITDDLTHIASAVHK
ncbi:Hypothetical predicted protein [Mytilus galloprovincialis]|uniref:Uncharacterized protein n=1 Tax=Mytilus galloprovincialis TaxID=29158 RepID=A0A8B6HIZ5_MYTGA|nr:Hypothetical predicted protein [Mytilus galloprovincialis]